MASTRLTNNIRESLLKKLLTRAFQERSQDLVDRCAAFAVRVYDDVYRGKLEQINGLPSGWLPQEDYVTVSMGTDHVRMRFNGSLGGWGLPEALRETGAVRENLKKPMPYGDASGRRVSKQYEATSKLAEEYEALKREQQDLCEEISAAKRTASAAMNSVSTVKKLIEVWPEVEEFAKSYLVEGERRAVLPDIPRDKLNAALNLPPEEQAA